MEIQFKQNGQEARFYINLDGEELAYLSITFINPTAFNIDHTVVSEKLAGQGVGKQLVLKAVEYARSKQLKIVPICTYATHVLKKDENLHDVLQN